MRKAHQRSRVRVKVSAPSRFKHWSWVVGAFIGGYFLSGIYDVASFQRFARLQVTRVLAKTKVPVPAVMAAPTPPPKPKLEFYTLLSTESSATSMPETSKPVVRIQASSAAPSSTDPGAQYSIQIAAFNTVEEATRMKSAWAAKGWPLNVVEIEQQHQQWFRVMVGPFSSQQEAEHVWKRIGQQEHIQGMIRKGSVVF